MKTGQAIRAFLNLYVAEIRRYVAETRVYLSGYVSSLITTAIVVALVVMSAKDGNDPSVWIGFLYWSSASTMVSEASVSISSDKQNGTFTQLMIRPTSMLEQITVKTLSWALVSIAVDAVFVIALFKLIGAEIGFSWMVMPVSLLVAVGVFGLTMAMASLTILFTKTASFMDTIGYAMMFLGGVIVPLNELPVPLRLAGQLIPITKGIEMSRSAILGKPLSAADWLGLSVQSLVFFTLGYLTFIVVIRHGRKNGINMRY